jgi:hypothetical protein
MQHFSCSISYLICYLRLVSTPEGTDWKVSEKKHVEDTVQVEIPVLKNGKNWREI